MIATFGEAIRLFGRHFGLLAAIILTVSLPANIFLDCFAENVAEAGELDELRASMLVEGIFSPIYRAALLYALFQIKSGRSVTYREAIAVGFKKWGSLFAARFVTGLMILGGLIAFVIPGVILSIRYALVDAVVVIEDEGTSGARARSAELTVGRRWRILGASILFFLVFVMSSTVVQLPLNFIEPLNTMPFIVVQDCLIDIASALIQIVMFVFYWEATQDESHSEDGAAPNGGPIEQSWDPRVTEGWPGVDDNPYRAPVSG